MISLINVHVVDVSVSAGRKRHVTFVARKESFTWGTKIGNSWVMGATKSLIMTHVNAVAEGASVAPRWMNQDKTPIEMLKEERHMRIGIEIQTKTRYKGQKRLESKQINSKDKTPDTCGLSDALGDELGLPHHFLARKTPRTGDKLHQKQKIDGGIGVIHIVPSGAIDITLGIKLG